MYIISKHKDYYDGVVGSIGIDKTIVYERNIEEITDHTKFPKEFRYKRYSRNNKNPFLNICGMHIDREKTKKYEDVHGFIVGFCGSLYPAWKFDYKEKEWNEEKKCFVDVTKIDIIYDLLDAVKFLKADYWRGNFEDDFQYVASYNPIQIFRDINAPVFIYDHDNRCLRKDSVFIINPILKDFEFYKVVDSFTAFQEISMFIGGVLGISEKNIIVVEDKYKIAQHGFDKWSFRKESQNK